MYKWMIWFILSFLSAHHNEWLKSSSWSSDRLKRKCSFLSWERKKKVLCRSPWAHLKWLCWMCFDPNATSYSRPAGLLLQLSSLRLRPTGPVTIKPKPWLTGSSPNPCSTNFHNKHSFIRENAQQADFSWIFHFWLRRYNTCKNILILPSLLSAPNSPQIVLHSLHVHIRGIHSFLLKLNNQLDKEHQNLRQLEDSFALLYCVADPSDDLVLWCLSIHFSSLL